ncbi:MAG: hypothetical protein K2Q18_16165 [Bdellovibrionales bacterium]|nr:hypothetical protein [Bdellovibrionales bacterium]
MKAITLIAMTFFSLKSFAGPLAQYYITEGKLHKGGKASVEVLENSEEKYTVKLTYELYKKILVPIPSDELKGESVLDFPAEFRDERGYMELESIGSMELPKATLKFVKRINWENLPDAYQFLILPKNGKSKIDIIYHPSVKAAGWAKILITFVSSTPILNGYQVEIFLNK